MKSAKARVRLRPRGDLSSYPKQMQRGTMELKFWEERCHDQGMSAPPKLLHLLMARPTLLDINLIANGQTLSEVYIGEI